MSGTEIDTETEEEIIQILKRGKEGGKTARNDVQTQSMERAVGVFTIQLASAPSLPGNLDEREGC